MKVNIEKAIKSITETIDFYQPLYEGIVNSFQADADKLNIRFTIEDRFVVGYIIEDNGEGFTDKNIDSFLTLWSDHKIKKGALGSGRILCLKVFDNILIESQTKDSVSKNGQRVSIDFHKKFDANTVEDIEPIQHTSTTSSTKTEFKNINASFEQTRQEYILEKIKDNIFIRLLPMFIHFNREEKDFSIKINGEEWLNKENLQHQFEEKQFKEKKFTIKKDMSKFLKDNDEKSLKEESFEFILHYRIIQDTEKQLEQFYGASDRYIMAFPKGIRLEKIDTGYSGIFCLTSTYLDKRVKDSRSAFVISSNQSNPTKDHPVTFPEINNELSKLLNEILKRKFPKIESEFKAKKEDVVKKFPHLSRYVTKIDNITITESEIQKRAEQEFLKETKLVREEVENFTKKIKQDRNYDEDAYLAITRHFTQVGREQLADYIGYRQTIIDMLLEIHDETTKDKKRFDESDIHNLFMPQYKTSDTLSTYANNVWIFDDKFMSYNYAASSKIISKIVSDVTGDASAVPKHHKNQEPDLVMFYSNPENEFKDILLIEFKRLNNVLSEKKKAITQLQDYPMYIRKNIDKVRSIFSYTIIDIDEPFREWLTDSQDFDEYAFGDDDNNVSSYYRYYEKVQSHVNVVSFKQILEDANKRNKVFLDILIQNFKSE